MPGAYALWGVFTGSPIYSKSKPGLGADGYGSASKIRLDAGSAFASEAIPHLRLRHGDPVCPSKVARDAMAGLAIGMAWCSATWWGSL